MPAINLSLGTESIAEVLCQGHLQGWHLGAWQLVNVRCYTVLLVDNPLQSTALHHPEGEKLRLYSGILKKSRAESKTLLSQNLEPCSDKPCLSKIL